MEICNKLIKKLKVIMEILRRTLVPQRTSSNLVQDSSIGNSGLPFRPISLWFVVASSFEGRRNTSAVQNRNLPRTKKVKIQIHISIIQFIIQA